MAREDHRLPLDRPDPRDRHALLGRRPAARLIVSVPWTQQPTDTYRAVRDQLTSEEAAELAATFDLDQPGGAA